MLRALLIFAWLLGVSFAQAAGITFSGRLLDASNDPVTAAAVTFRVQIRSPGGEDCLLFQEDHVRDMSASDGHFEITLGDGTAAVPNSAVVNGGPSTIDGIFQNRGMMTFSGGSCTIGTAYFPGVSDGRKMIIEFDAGGGWDSFPAADIDHVPRAVDSIAVGGFKATDLFRVLDGSGNPAALTAWTQAEYNTLRDLVVNGPDWTDVTGKPATFTPASHSHLVSDITSTGGAFFTYQPGGIECGDGAVLKWTAANRWECATDDTGGGSGETNTASNVGGAGVGVFEQKNGANLEFRNISAGSTKVTVSLDGLNKEIEIDVNEGNLSLANMTGVVPVAKGGTGLNATGTNSVLLTDGSGDPFWSGISSDSFSQYALLAGRSGGQTIRGGMASGDDLTIESTSHATKGDVIIQPTGGKVGIGTTSPAALLEVSNTVPTQDAKVRITADQRAILRLRSQQSDVSRKAWDMRMDFSGHLQFGTLNDGEGTFTENVIFRGDTGNVGIGTMSPSEKLEVAGKIKGTELCIAADCRNAWPAGGGSGTVTDVTSTNSYLSVANGTSAPELTLNVGTTANTVAAGNDSRFTDSRAPSGTAGGDLGGTYPNPDVVALQGTAVSASGPTAGHFLKYDGTEWGGSAITIADVTGLSTELGEKLDQANMPGACGAHQTLTFSSPTGIWTCSDINNLNADKITSGTLAAARIPNNEITSAHILDGTIAGADLSNASITNAKINDVAWDKITGVPGGIVVNGGNTFGGAMTLGTNDNNPLNFETNGTTKMVIEPGGAIGMGTTPAANTALHIVRATNPEIKIGQTVAVAGRIGISTGAGQISNNSLANSLIIANDVGVLHFGTATSSPSQVRMTIATDGKVGIGTTSPTEKLEIAGGGVKTGGNVVIGGGTPTLTSTSNLEIKPETGYALTIKNSDATAEMRFNAAGIKVGTAAGMTGIKAAGTCQGQTSPSVIGLVTASAPKSGDLTGCSGLPGLTATGGAVVNCTPTDQEPATATCFWRAQVVGVGAIKVTVLNTTGSGSCFGTNPTWRCKVEW